jgi:hypothetical protein
MHWFLFSEVEESRKRKLQSDHLIEIDAFSGVNYAEFHLKAFLRLNAMLRVERSVCPRYEHMISLLLLNL